MRCLTFAAAAMKETSTGKVEAASAAEATVDAMDTSRELVAPQPEPIANAEEGVWPIVIRDMEQRNKDGIAKYGTPLQPHNGRDALVDAYQEALDLCVYLRQVIYERDKK